VVITPSKIREIFIYNSIYFEAIMAKKEGAAKAAEQPRVKTGIPGFEALVQGGLIPNSINLIKGGPGTGKTIFSLQYLWKGLTEFNENCAYISFDNNPERIKEDALLDFGWDFEKFEKQGKAKFIRIDPYSTTNIQSDIEDVVTKAKAKRLVIDSLTTLRVSLKDSYIIRKSLYLLMEALAQMGCTTVATSEMSRTGELGISEDSSLEYFDLEEFAADSITVLYNAGLGGKSDRALRVIKMRRTDHVKGPVPAEISGKGFKILGKSEF
jgi:circadian clock protein KaiC